LLGFDEAAQRPLRSDQVVLADELVEGPGPQQVGERRRLFQALGDGVVEE
jgi:hypothetical protein